MGVAADADALKPSPPPPPPARIVVAVLVVARFVLAPMPPFGRVALVAGRALQYLCLAIAWVLSAGSAATVVARHACREGSAPLLFFEAFTDAAFKFSICIIFLFLALLAVVLCGVCLVSLVAVVSGSGSEFKKSACGAITRVSTQKLPTFPRAMVLGLVADLAFILLIVAGILVMLMSPQVEGSISQGEMIGSVIVDVGLFVIHAISCLVIIPAFALHILRDDQEDRKAGPTVVVIVC